MALTLGVNLAMGTPFTVRLLVEATAYGLIALGLNVQFGYGGLFNLAIMGLLMIGGMTVSSVSMPINWAFWNSDGPMMLGRVLLAAIAGVLLIVGTRNLWRIGIPRGLVTWLTVLAWFVGYVALLWFFVPRMRDLSRSSS